MAVEGAISSDAVLVSAQIRVTQVVVQPAISSDASARVTQVVLQPAVATDATARMSQLVVQIAILRADAVVTRERSFIANAAIAGGGSGSISATAIVRRTIAGSFTANAWLARPGSGAFTAAAWIFAGSYEFSFPADAIIEITWGPWSETGSNATVWHLTADAFLIAHRTGSITADAYRSTPGQGTLTANATFRKTQTASLTADAVISEGAVVHQSLTADANIFGPVLGSLSADAYIYSPIGWLPARAIIQAKRGSYLENIAPDQPIAYLDGRGIHTPEGSSLRTWPSHPGSANIILNSETGQAKNFVLTGCGEPDWDGSDGYWTPRTIHYYSTYFSGGYWNRAAYSTHFHDLGTVTPPFTVEVIFRHHRTYTYAFPGDVPIDFPAAIFGGSEVNYKTSIWVTSQTQLRVLIGNTGYSAYLVDQAVTVPDLGEPPDLGGGEYDQLATPQHHLALVVGATTWAVYLDGASVGDGSYSGSAILHEEDDDAHRMWMGIDASATDAGAWQGTFTSLAIYDKTLDATTVARHAKLWTLGLTLDAELNRGGQIHAYAELLIGVRVIASFTTDASLVGVITNSLTANALFFQQVEGSISARALLRATIVGSFSADAAIGYKLTTDAIIKATIISSFPARAWIYSPRTEPPGPNQTKLVEIFVDDVDITDNVVFSEATFTQNVNGAPGQFHLRVNDPAHTRTFVSGAEIRLDIDGRTRFGGYVTQVHRAFAFPYEDTSVVASVDRYWILEGVDYNILFTKRVLYDKATPTNIELRSWAAGTPDTTIIRYVFDQYTDLGADGATCESVEHVGHPNPDKVAVVGSGGLTFGDAMREINRLINAVWYFDQCKDLHFADVDVANAHKELSDQPTAAQAGYRDFTVVHSGSSLANDALVWGTGRGNDHMAFARSEDATSIATHGRWQYGEFTSSLYKQASVQARADSIVDGTPQSLRGAKNDRVSWTLTTFDPAFVVGEKVNIENTVFGISDVIPIRRMTITFPTKTDPQFQLVLSHEIDEPWNMYEFYFPRFSFNFKIPKIDVNVDPPQPPCVEGECTDEDCGITDTFNRYVAVDWGISDSGNAWDIWHASWGAAVAEVNGSAGRLYIPPDDDSWAEGHMENVAAQYVLAKLRFDGEGNGWNQIDIEFGFSTPGGTYDGARGGITLIGSNDIFDADTEGDGVFTPSFSLASWFWLRHEIDPDTYNARYRVWADGSAEPEWWRSAGNQSLISILPEVGYAEFDTYRGIGLEHEALTFEMDSFDITGVNRCTRANFDDFNRTVTGGTGAARSWGTASSGVVWTPYQPWFNNPSTSASVNPILGGIIAFPPDDGGSSLMYTPVLPQLASGTFTITIRVGPYAPTNAEEVELYLLPNASPPPDWDTVCMCYVWNGWNEREVYVGDSGNGDSWFDYVGPSWDGTLLIKWQRIDGVSSNVKAWLESDPEPAEWTITCVAGTIAPASVALGVAITNVTKNVDYINITYDGMPCYTQQIVIDTFTRTIADGWGTSDFGTTWTQVGGDGTPSVDGSHGTMTCAAETEVDMELPITSVTTYHLTGTIIPPADWGIGDGDQVCALELLNASGGTVRIHVGLAFNTPYDLKAGYVHLKSHNTSGEYVGYDFVVDTEYDFDWTFDTVSGASAFTIWPGGTTMPSTPTLTFTSTDEGAVSVFYALYVNFDDTENSMAIDDLYGYFPTYGTGSDCPPATEGPGSTNTTGGGTQTVFQLPVRFAPGSTRVWVNGYFQRPGASYDYTEQPTAGTITFTTAPTGDIHIEYEARGSL